MIKSVVGASFALTEDVGALAIGSQRRDIVGCDGHDTYGESGHNVVAAGRCVDVGGHTVNSDTIRRGTLIAHNLS
jgi:hypothetical protein